MKEKTTDTASVFDFGALPYATHARLTVPVTIVQGIHPTPIRHITLSELLAEIETTHIAKLNHAQSLVCAYEEYLQNVEKGIEKPKKAYEAKKDELYGFQLGKFAYRNNQKANCLEYVPCQVFDLDGCASTYEVFLYQQKLKELDYVFAAFASPSGYGLRILIWTTSTYETHKTVYLQILARLCNHLELTTEKQNGTHFDTTCKNESRHFYYVAIDPKAFYLNLESKILEIPVTAPVPPEKVLPPLEKKGISFPKGVSSDSYTYIDALNDEVKIEYILKSVDMNKPRKIQCFYFGCVCRENNVDFDAALRTAHQRFYDSDQNHPDKVVETQLKDGYNYSSVRYNDEQFIVFLRKTHNVIVKSNSEPVGTTTATVPIEKSERKLNLEKKYPNAAFYARLPTILKQCTEVLTHEMDKHVFLWGAFPAISSICCDVSGIYDKKKVYACYYAYIVATGGAGKGALDYARQLVWGVAQKLQEENEKRTLFVPTNIGNTQLVQKLHDNGGRGLFFETEGGIVAKMSKSENMDLSDTLRKGFHHEMLLLARKMDKLDIAIHELRLSVVISGTFSQLLPTIKEGEDGLFSRFNYLYLTGNYEFKNVFDRQNSENVRRIFAETSQKMVLLFELLQNRTITFEFTEEQEKAFLLFFTEQKNEMMNHLSDIGEGSREIFSGAMNRIGLMCFRAAMILTVLRSFEEGHLEKKEENTPEKVLICNEDDFQTALEFAELARNNALAVFNRIYPIENGNTNTTSKAQFKAQNKDNALKMQKEGKSLSDIALAIGAKKSTIQEWLK